MSNAHENITGFKVFAGNLSYSTTDEGLKTFFAPIESDIISAHVTLRGTRSAGYGFVTVSSSRVALKAVALLNGLEFDGRKITVEIAKPAEEKEKRAKRCPGKRSAKANGVLQTDEFPVAPGTDKATKPKKKKKKNAQKLWRNTAVPMRGDAPDEVDSATTPDRVPVKKDDTASRKRQKEKLHKPEERGRTEPVLEKDKKDKAPAGEEVEEETLLEQERAREAKIAESIRKLRDLEKDRPMWEALHKEREAQAHEAAIAESIRKLRELEKDRPMWEAQRKAREARELVEERVRLARAERRRKEEERRERQEQEIAERRKREIEEAERCARERRQHERRQRQRIWEYGPWTTLRALERYRALCDQFDVAKFTSEDDIIFEDIPWPVLHAPTPPGIMVENVDWTAVEAFFAAMKACMPVREYKEFVEKSHRRFHPDRWRARRIWGAVRDDVERSKMEATANTVTQAITPIWRGIKDACS